MKKIVNKKILSFQMITAFIFVLLLLDARAQDHWVTLPDGRQIVGNKNTPIFYTYSTENGKLKSLHMEDPQEIVKVIVTLKNKPLALYLKKNVLQKTSLINIKSSLRSVHSSVINKISSVAQQLSTRKNFQYQYKVLHEYYTAINGIALECNRGMIKAIQNLPEVKDVQLDGQVKANLTQSIHQIRADIVQDSLGYTGDGVLIGEIDTGIDYNNPALGAGFGTGFRVMGGYDFANNDNDPMDDNGHGTHVAGIIGADNEKDLRGVAPKVKFLAVKVLDNNGQGYSSDVIAGIEYCMDPDGNPTTNDGADIINMSLGALPTGNFSTDVDDAVDNATQAGILSVVAAGNDGMSYPDDPLGGPYRTISSPGTAPSALTVGACDSTYYLALFSSKGPDRIHFAIKPEVVAPGVNILSTILHNRTASWSGTSMATPHVTGVAALLKQEHPDWSPEQLKSVIVNSAKIMTDFDDPYTQGNGCVDALNATTLDVSVQPGVLNLGIVNLSADVWKDTVEFKVKNLKNISQNINLEVQSGLPTGIELNLSQTSFTLPSMQEKQVTAIIAIDKSVPIVAHSPYGYKGNIICLSDSDRVKIPFAVIKTNILTIECDADAWGLSLYNDRTDLEITLQTAGIDNKFSLPWIGSKYNLFALLHTSDEYRTRDTFYCISRKDINTGESSYIKLSRNEAVFSAFNNLDQVRDIYNNPVSGLDTCPVTNTLILSPHLSTGFLFYTPKSGQWYFSPIDSSVILIQDIFSARENEVLYLKTISSGLKSQSDLTLLSGPENLGDLNLKFKHILSYEPFIETLGVRYSDLSFDGLSGGYLLPNIQNIHFMTNRITTAFNPFIYYSMSAGIGTINYMGFPDWQITTSQFIVNENGNIVFFERKPFRPDRADYVNIQTLPSSDTVTVEEADYFPSIRVPKFQLLSQYYGGNDLTLSQFNPDVYDDGGVICSDGIHIQSYNSNGAQFTPQMFTENNLLKGERTEAAGLYYNYRLNKNTDRYNLIAETYAYNLLGQFGLTTIDYEFNVKTLVSQYYFLPSLDLFQILADGKLAQWIHPGQNGKVRLVLFDPKHNVDSVNIYLLKNDGTEISLATSHSSEKEYFTLIPQDIPDGFLDVVARVHNTEGNIFTLTVSPAFYFGTSMDSIQYDSRLRLKTYSLNNKDSVQFDPGDTLKYILTFENYGNSVTKNISIHFPTTDYFVPVGNSTITLDSIWISRGGNTDKTPLTLIFLGKKQPDEKQCYYYPVVTWKSGERTFTRKYKILVDFEGVTTGVRDLENSIPNTYALSQNFPNPFNPTTKINYSVPQNSFVTISVYDILGNEVATLVKGEKPAGNYEVTWNAKGLSSGIYFYQLKSGNFIQTKKLVLLK